MKKQNHLKLFEKNDKTSLNILPIINVFDKYFSNIFLAAIVLIGKNFLSRILTLFSFFLFAILSFLSLSRFSLSLSCFSFSFFSSNLFFNFAFLFLFVFVFAILLSFLLILHIFFFLSHQNIALILSFLFR